jgi:hypothetical protein
VKLQYQIEFTTLVLRHPSIPHHYNEYVNYLSVASFIAVVATRCNKIILAAVGRLAIKPKKFYIYFILVLF